MDNGTKEKLFEKMLWFEDKTEQAKDEKLKSLYMERSNGFYNALVILGLDKEYLNYSYKK